MIKKTILIIALLLATVAQAQQRDRLAELEVVCRNEAVTYTSVAPDGTLWMATLCGEIFRADNIHSPWRTLQKGELFRSPIDSYEDIIAFDSNTAVIVGNGDFIKRTTDGGRSWENIRYTTQRYHDEWFHHAWRGVGGQMWAGSQDGYLAFSADSGRTFSALRDTAFDVKAGIDDIYMLSADSGWIACGKGIYSTSDNWRSWHRWPTPMGKKVDRVRPWRGGLVAMGDGSYYAPLGDSLRWQRMPVRIRGFEVDTATGMMWAIDDSRQVILMESLDRWRPMGVRALFTIGLHDGHLYCRTETGVIRVGADGTVDRCPLLTDEQPMAEPEQTLRHGGRLWGYDEKSVYIKDKQGWYRVARPVDIAGLTPDPDRKDRVIVVKQEDEFGWREAGTFSIDLAGRMEPYTYRQPLAAFAKPGLASMEIKTYTTFGTHVRSETICYARNGKSLTQTSHTKTHENYDPHLHNGPTTETETLTDTAMLQLPAEVVEKALQRLGESYNDYPTPQDFGLEDTALDLHKVYTKRNTSSSNRYGYTITLVNRAGDTLTASGNTSAYCDLGSSTRFPWLLPMTVQWRGAMFTTHQPTLWQVLREAMPDSMQLRSYLDNNTLRPEDTLQSGDLLFISDPWTTERGGALAAIGWKYTRVALVERDGKAIWIIESTPDKGVQRIPYGDFKRRLFRMGFDVYRLTTAFDTAAVIARAKSLVGKPYDNAFLPDNDAYYNSELLQVAFGNLFPSAPMRWRDKEGRVPQYWQEHFEKLGMPVPEGVMGTTTTSLSQSKLLRIINDY